MNIRLSQKIAVSLLALISGATSPAQAASPSTEKPPAEYCEALREIDAIAASADKHFANDGSDGKWDQRRQWIGKREQKVLSKVTKHLKQPYEEWSVLASENFWANGCEALRFGWQIVTKTDLSDVPDEAILAARGAMEVEYSKRLTTSPDENFFNPELYSTASCREASVEGFRFLGCKMRSISNETDPDIFLIANINAKTVIIPYDREAQTRLQGTSIIRSEPEGIALGYYVGEMPLVEYRAIRKNLE